ncbi:MAG TPA: cell wall-binding repeat-containing protein [Acidimicrobiales bacterium]|nr:cell wall-binding repeat-containing protein [Acidimicrobiales bacterium]
MRRMAVVLVLGLVTTLSGLVPAASAADCPSFGDVQGENPAPSAVATAVREVAAARNVPPTILAAIAFVEGYDPASARNWIQFRADGSPLVSADCGIGMMQVTNAASFDDDRLASDWRYNLDAGAQILRDKWEDSQAANPASLGADDPAFLENWWAAVFRYNGQGAAAAAYADRVFAQAVDPQAEPAIHVPPLPTLRTPTNVFPAYTTSQQFQARATTAVLTDDTGTVLATDETFRPTTAPAATRPPAPRVAADATSAVEVGVQLSRVAFGDGAARHAIVARHDDWADALAGSALSGDWGPILFTGPTLPDATRAELLRVLDGGGTVYLLGGTAAVSSSVESAITSAGLAPRRLAGTSRLETSLAIAEEVRRLSSSATQVLVARAFDSPADALTGGAAAAAGHRPVVLTPTASMPQALRDRVRALGVAQAVVLGGTAAVSEQVVSELRTTGLTVDRLAGTDRYETAASIATGLWGGVRRDAVAVDLASPDGWAWALAAASLGGPQLGVSPSTVPAATTAAVRAAGASAADPVRVIVVGSAARASTDVRRALRVAAEGG